MCFRDKLSAHAGPHLRGVLLSLLDIYQRQERQDAIACPMDRVLAELPPCSRAGAYAPSTPGVFLARVYP